MNRVLPPVAETVPVQKPAPPRVFHRIILHSLLLLIAAAAFVAYQHFKLNGQSTQALLSLVAAGLLALAPLRALIGELFAIEGKLLHALSSPQIEHPDVLARIFVRLDAATMHDGV